MPRFERKAVLTIMLENLAFAAKKNQKTPHSEHVWSGIQFRRYNQSPI